jgi:hypothetical protein
MLSSSRGTTNTINEETQPRAMFDEFDAQQGNHLFGRKNN